MFCSDLSEIERDCLAALCEAAAEYKTGDPNAVQRLLELTTKKELEIYQRLAFLLSEDCPPPVKFFKLNW